MCHYCGCRQIPLIRDYIAEHERALTHGFAALRALDAGSHDEAQQQIAQMHAELRSHWRGEEDGVFAVLRTEELYAEHIDPLVAEHRALDALLESLDARGSRTREELNEQIVELREHISKEEDGIFPATLVELNGQEWAAARAAWQAAHPGQHLIED